MKQEEFNFHHTHTICTHFRFLSHTVSFFSNQREEISSFKKDSAHTG